MPEPSRSVLIVDDDEEFLGYQREMLKPMGWEIISAKTAGSAREELRRRLFAMVLTDLSLPDGSGLDVLQSAREVYPLTVGIVLTAHSSVDSALEALRDGAYDYLLKPLNPDVLQAAARRGMRHYELNYALTQKSSELADVRRQLDGKSLLLENVTHELKNPLTVVHGYTNFLLKQKPDEFNAEAVRHNLQFIQKNAERLGAMLEELFESARLSANKIALTKTETLAASAAAESVSGIQFTALKKELRVSLDAAGADALKIDADPARLQQILSNLLGNAVKFTPEGGEIALSVSKDGAFARFSVRDSGIGIADADIPFLFERFYQVHNPEKNQKGLGLGLEICRRLVELHGGRIWAESRLGCGSTFHFTIPLASELTPRT